MAPKAHRTERRTDALSKSRIVVTAIDILDAGGERALTFRALTARLATGAGAIYHHVADKDQLLTATTEHVIAGVLENHRRAGAQRPGTQFPDAASPHEAIRTFALGIFDVIDAHPWVGTELARQPWQLAMAQIFEAVGVQLHALGVAQNDLFNAGSALVNYILGVAGQNAANARQVPVGTDRATFLNEITDRWLQHDAEDYPFVHMAAAQLREHDDREQFLAGIDIFLAGVQSQIG